MKKNIAVLAGDGIGPEIVSSTTKVLTWIGRHFDHTFTFEYANIGGIAIDEEGTPLPQTTIDICKQSDAILLGAVGGPKWDQNPSDLRPEKGLLQIRKTLGLFANLRPVTVFPSLADSSSLKKEIIAGCDIMIVRELTGGIYFGTPRERRQSKSGEIIAVDTLTYTYEEIKRIAIKAFELARVRNKKLTSVDKANVLESSRLWREVVEEVAQQFPDVVLDHMLVDNAAMQLVRNPKYFDVLLTENMFGDILSDEGSMLTGSLGMLPSASLSADGPGLYEPVHGSAPDIAGQNKANPLATMLSAGMMLRYSFQMETEAALIETAINDVLEAGNRTADIMSHGVQPLTTEEMTEKVITAMTNRLTTMSAN